MITKHQKIRMYLKLIGQEDHLPEHEKGDSAKLANVFMREMNISLKDVNAYCLKVALKQIALHKERTKQEMEQ